jgi:4-hydroxybenzoate polyprenyltransferase
LLLLFIAGTAVMRSAGCIINDLADRNIDPHVKRTRLRPLAARAVSPYEALALFGALLCVALLLALQLNALSIKLAFIGAALTVSYPLLKRFFPMPQLYLGLCFGWGVPMAFAATLGFVPREGWLTLVAAVLWAGIYDTEYAMVDRDDDLRVGVQSSAILFGDMDRLMIAVMQAMMLLALALLGRALQFDVAYYGGLAVGALLFAWQQWLIRDRDRAACLQAFQNNNYFGIAIFAGILIEYATSR